MSFRFQSLSLWDPQKSNYIGTDTTITEETINGNKTDYIDFHPQNAETHAWCMMEAGGSDIWTQGPTLCSYPWRMLELTLSDVVARISSETVPKDVLLQFANLIDYDKMKIEQDQIDPSIPNIGPDFSAEIRNPSEFLQKAEAASQKANFRPALGYLQLADQSLRIKRRKLSYDLFPSPPCDWHVDKNSLQD